METKEHSIKKNYIYSLSYQILTIIVPLVTTPYLSRILEPDGVGVYSLTNTNASYFTLIGVLGLGTYGQLEIAKARDNINDRSKLFFEIMLTRICTHVICILAYVVLILISVNYKIMYMFQGILIIASMFDLTWYFQGLEEFKGIAIRNTVIKIISVVLIFLLVTEKSDLLVYTCILSVSSLLCNICFYPILGKFICKVDFNILSLRKHIQGSLVFFLPTIASVIMTSLDKTMIGIITHSERENGYYAQAYKIETLCFSLFSSLNMVLRSRMVYLFHNNKEEQMSDYLFRVLKFVSFIAFPISLGTIAITNNFVPWFFGAGYEKVAILLPIFAFWLIFKSHSNCLLEQYVMATGRQKKFNIIVWAGAVCNIFLNSILIYYFQSIGAALASVISELLILILTLRASKDVIMMRSMIILAWKYCMAALIMSIIVFLIGTKVNASILSTIVQVGIGAICYITLLCLFRDSLIREFAKMLSSARRIK